MDKQLLGKYLEGSCSEEERKEVEKYLMEEKADFTPFREMLEQSWDKGVGELVNPGDPLLKKELQDVLHEQLFPEAGVFSTDNKAARQTPVIGLRGRSSRRFRYGMAAAVASILILGSLLWGRGFFHKTSVTSEPAIVWKTLINTGSEQKRGVLPDNTHIWLNPGSQLSYASGLIGQQRLIKLQGEAFFDVAQDAAHPFIVLTSRLSTKVLGTAFNIEAYPTEQNVRVSLVNGKVSVQGNEVQTFDGQVSDGQTDNMKIKPIDSPELLEAGQLFTYNISSGEHHTGTLKMRSINDWTSGQIVFNDVPLKDALERVAARYQLVLVYAKGIDLKNKRFTSVFKKETPDEMLQLMLFISDCHFRRKGNTVEIF